MRGRKPKPTMLADLHGRPSHNKAPANEPKPMTGDLAEPPEFLSPEQQAAWVYAIQHAPPGLLKHMDRTVLTVWIVAEDIHRQAVMAQQQTTLLVEHGANKVEVQSLYIGIMNRQAAILLKAAGEMGFTPVARPRIGMVPALSLPAEAPRARASAPAPQRSLDAFLDSHPDTDTQH